ncbi:preprotein translocase subunit SecE [Candidatus Kaiserbacteria bacterium]|nr:preprotein translocase subunit SecE [Candidatus Kaiserbacteria bacterium]
MQQLINYLKDTRAEFRHVTWPTQKQAVVYTALIIGISIAVALLLGVFDYLFTWILDWFIGV